MNKSNLIKELSMQTRYSENCCNNVISEFIILAKDALKKGEKISITSFGTFELKILKERTVINPQTRRKMYLKERAVPCFRCSKKFKNLI